MDRICRLCLTISANMTCKLEEGTIVHKLSTLNVVIVLNEALPNSVCCICTKMIDNISSYREHILYNQHKLMEQLCDGKIVELYQNLKHDIKTEFDTEDTLNQTFGCEFEPTTDTNSKNTDKETVISSKYLNFEPITTLNHKLTNHETVIPLKCPDKSYESVFCKFIDPNNKKKDKTAKKWKETTKLKKGNDTYDTTVKKRKKKPEKKVANPKIVVKNRKSIAITENRIHTKYDEKVCTKPSENISNINLNRPEDGQTIETNLENTKSKISARNKLEVVINKNTCLTCFKYFPSNKELIKHYRTIHNNTNKKNKLTDVMINNKNKETVVENSRPYKCKICGRTFTKVYYIMGHARTHMSDYRLSCSRGCGFTTAYRGALSDHEKRHEKKFKYKCGTCGAGFHVKTWHEQHQNKHKNIKPFVCDFCGMAFHMVRYLTAHRLKVHAQPTKALQRCCPYCDLTFSDSTSFNKHLEEHTGKKKEKLLCALCGKAFGSADQLRYHNNAHLGVKPFNCSICNKQFARRFNLTVHLRAHAGDRTLCARCGKHFAQRSSLNRHARVCHLKNKEISNKSKINGQ